jgi:hypothetical protein
VHHHVFQRNTRLRKGGAKSLDTLRTNGGFVAVVLRGRSKDLERARTRGRGAKRGHVNATVWYGMNTNEVRQSALLARFSSVMVRTAIHSANRDS